MPSRILIVEDNPINLELMEFMIKAAGHDPLLAPDGATGLDMARRERPDLILLDILMPGMDGYEVARQLKSDASLAAIPLVAVTALARAGDYEKTLAAGFDGHISKPINIKLFMQQVENFLAGAGEARRE